ncbi:MAG: hypothetical protein RL291_129, partial [Pseudomonadota bacterium]
MHGPQIATTTDDDRDARVDPLMKILVRTADELARATSRQEAAQYLRAAADDLDPPSAMVDAVLADAR